MADDSEDEASYARRRLAGLQRSYADEDLPAGLEAALDRARRHMATLGIATPAQIAEIEASISASLLVPALGSDSPTSASLLDDLLDEIERALPRIGAQPLADVVIGPVQERLVNAAAGGGFGARIIMVTMQQLQMAHLLAKACGPIASGDSPLSGASNGDFCVGMDCYKIALSNLASLRHSYRGGNISSAASNAPPDPRYWAFVAHWTHSIERFVIAHEYCHLLHCEDDQGALMPGDLIWNGVDAHESEAIADRFAARLEWVDATEDSTNWSHIAPLAYFWFRDRVADGGPLVRESHPAPEIRIALLESEIPTTSLREHWAVCKRRLDDAWRIVAGSAASS